MCESTISPDDHVDRRARLAFLCAEAASVVELQRSRLVFNRVFEGLVDLPGQMTWMPESPLRIVSLGPVDPERVVAGVQRTLQQLERLSPSDRTRLQLASRWFERGMREANPLDAFLCFWTVLEVHPCAGTTDIPGATARYLGTAFPDLTPKNIKAALQLGPAFSFRSRIVHDGLALVPAADDAKFNELYDRLRAAAQAVLRILAGLPAGEELQTYLSPSAAAR